MKLRVEKTSHDSKPEPTGLTNFSLGRLEISTEEILADLRYPSAPVRERRR